MLFEYFEDLRKKPREVRKRFALFFSGACTSVVIVIWIISLLLNAYGARGTKNEVTKSEVVETQETTSTMFEKANTFMNDISAGGNASQEEWEEASQEKLDPSLVVGDEEFLTHQGVASTSSAPADTSMENIYATPTRDIFESLE